MSEEPKSIWRKSWHGPAAWLLAWMGLMVATVIIFWLVLSILGNARPYESKRLFMASESLITGLFLLVVLVHWLRSWRNVKRLLFGLACLATLTALFYAEENWRGKRAWDNYKREWAAKGENFDYRDFVPPPVPDDQNFAMAPIWVESIKATLGPERARLWYGDKFPDNGRTNFVERLRLDLYHADQTAMPEMEQPKPGNWEHGETTDLRAWQKYYRVSSFTNPPAKAFTNSFPVAPEPQSPAADVLLALSKYDPAVEELRLASRLPEARFPVEYDKDDPAAILLPHLAALKRGAQLLQLRSVAELQNDQVGKSFDDIKLSLRLADSVRTEPFIITHLVRLAILSLTLQPVYEGLAEHKWSDAQLASLDADLAKINFLADYEHSARSERAAHAKIIDWLEQKRSRFFDLFNMVTPDERKQVNSFGLTAGLYLMPRGWFYRSDIVMSDVHQQWIQPMVDDAHQTVSPELARKAKEAVGALRRTPINLFARLLLPELGTYAQRVAFGQTAANEARVAIALERWRLAHGNFPESLDALVPQFIARVPQDVMGGQPLKYRRTEGGRFMLYSVGWNEKDDGGAVVIAKGSNDVLGGINRDEGDWVWEYPR